MNQIIRNTQILDADSQSIGRVATQAALMLRGKNKADFAPHIDAGDFVKIKNASKVNFTGKKFVQKDFYHHTNYPGGLKVTSMKKIFEKDPSELIKRAIYGMLPKNKLREEMMKRLTIEN